MHSSQQQHGNCSIEWRVHRRSECICIRFAVASTVLLDLYITATNQHSHGLSIISPCGSRVAIHSNSSCIPADVTDTAIASSWQRTIDHLRTAMIAIITISSSCRLPIVECGSFPTVRHSRIIHLCAILLFRVGWKKQRGLFVVSGKKGKVPACS